MEADTGLCPAAELWPSTCLPFSHRHPHSMEQARTVRDSILKSNRARNTDGDRRKRCGCISPIAQRDLGLVYERWGHFGPSVPYAVITQPRGISTWIWGESNILWPDLPGCTHVAMTQLTSGLRERSEEARSFRKGAERKLNSAGDPEILLTLIQAQASKWEL